MDEIMFLPNSLIPGSSRVSEAADLPFWSDDFDMDLPKIIPEARERLGQYASLELLTYGNASYGRLNCPDCWNHTLGSVAWFGRKTPFKPDSYVTSSPLVRCTLWEVLRDVWAHDFVLVFEGNPIWKHPEMWEEHFYPLMEHVRNERVLDEKEVREHKLCVLDAISQLRMLLRAHLARHPAPVTTVLDVESFRNLRY